MDDRKESKSSLPLPVILLISTFIIGGVFKYYAPLDSMRPPHEDRRVAHLSTEEDILSRMWQDPFQAVERHEKIFKTLPGQQKKIRPNIEEKDVEDGLLILPVLTTVGTYAESIEKRLRSRYALLSALHVAGYRSKDAGHIGVFSLNDKGDNGEDSCSCVVSGNIDDRHHHLVPYEWFILDSLNVDVNDKNTVKNILVLWVADAYFHDDILVGLNGLLNIVETPVKTKVRYNEINENLIKKCSYLKDNNEEIENEIGELIRLLKLKPIIKRKIIGPSNSVFLKKIYKSNDKPNEGIEKNSDSELRESLLRLVNELKVRTGFEDEIKKLHNIIDKLEGCLKSTEMQFISPWATADPFLLHDQLWKDSDPMIEDKFSEIKSGDVIVSLIRSIHTDQQLTDELVVELERRGINLKNDSKDHIILISEWDTNYGRALPLSFANSIKKYRQNIGSITWPEHIHKLTYMRGVDGILPDEHALSSSSAKSADTQRTKDKSSNMGYYTPEFKQPLGQAQYDYIRRLEDRINQIPLDSNGEIRAIGVLGSDIYDKLLILRALRRMFPNAIFFTNDMDARLFHETELPWTRNLIVASSYGLQLHPKWQKDIPPFRNVYQTSLFAATLYALGVIDDSDIDLKENPPRIFEIGRKGPYDLTPGVSSGFSVRKLCGKIIEKKEIDSLFLDAPRNTTDWLNELLRIPNLYNILQKDRPYNNYVISKLVKETSGYRNKSYHALNYQEQMKVKRLNRLLLEETYSEYPPMNHTIAGFIHPGRNDLRKGISWVKILVYLFIMFIFPLLLFAYLIYHRIHNAKEETEKTFKTLWVLSFGVPCILSFLALTCIVFIDSWSGVGEPLTFINSISIWPTVLMRLFSGFLAIYFVLISIKNMIFNSSEIEHMLTGKVEDKTPHQNYGHIVEVWGKYQTDEGGVKKSISIAGSFAFAYFCIVVVSLNIFGWPYTPFRGDLSYYTDVCILIFSLLSMFFLSWFVINRVYYCRKFFSDISTLKTEMPLADEWNINCSLDKVINRKACGKNEIECQKGIGECLVDYGKWLSDFVFIERLKTVVIAKRTEVIGRAIVYSFIVFAILLISRNQIFDCWTWPKPLIVAICLTIFIGVYYAFILFNAANTIRKETISSLYNIRLSLMNVQIPTILKTIIDLHEKIKKATKAIEKKKLEDRVTQLTFIDEEISKLIEQKINQQLKI